MITLRVKLPSGANEKISIKETSTISQLRELLTDSYPQELENHPDYQLLYSFPPKRIDVQQHEEPVSCVLRHMDPLIVQIQSGVLQSSPLATATKKSKSTTTTKKSKSIATTKKRKVKETTSCNTSSKSVKLSFGANIHSITSSSASSDNKKKNIKKNTTRSGSKSISFGATTRSLSSSSGRGSGGVSTRRKENKTTRTRTRRSRLELSSEDDIGTSLLTAVSASGSAAGSKKNKFLRGTFRRAVAMEYEASKAQARVMSLISGKYSIQESQTARTLGSSKINSESSQIIVQFHKGHGNRSFYFETVDLLSRIKLKAVVKLILLSSSNRSDEETSHSSRPQTEDVEEDDSSTDEGKELLRARYMSQCSPRIFWSLVYHYGPNIPSALTRLLPQEDWSWLVGDEQQDVDNGIRRRREGLGGGKDGDSVRRRVLSEKALENKRQAQDVAREKEEKREMKRLLASQRGTSEDQIIVDVDENEDDDNEKVDEKTKSEEEVTEYQGPLQRAEDMLKSVLLPIAIKDDMTNFRFNVLSRALGKIFCVDGVVTSDNSNENRNRFLLQMLHAIADTSLPPDGDDNDLEDIDSGMSLLNTLESEMQRQCREYLESSSQNQYSCPFITLSHLRHWILTARWVLMRHFWTEELGGAGANLIRLLKSKGIIRVRDLALWRHSPKDLVVFLSEGMDDVGGDSLHTIIPSEVDLRRICLLANSFRDQCEWVDDWNYYSELFVDEADVNSWNESTPLPHYCTDMLPEVKLNKFRAKDAEGEEEDNDEEWENLSDYALYEEVLGLRRLKPRPDESMTTTLSYLGRQVAFRVDDEGTVVSDISNIHEETQGELQRGIVVAYLPPSADEPMALWKVLLQSGQFQDLEQFEVESSLSTES